MKTKRELLKHFAKCGNCEDIACTECPYYEVSKHCPNNNVSLKKIGAMAILRMFREKKKPILEVGTKIKFSDGDIATVVFLRKEYYLMFESHKEKLDYLIGRVWEFVE